MNRPLRLLSVLVPVYNEAGTIRRVLQMVSAAPCAGMDKEIIIVDDASTDGTRQLLQATDLSQYNARLYLHDVNRGKGAALRTAQEHTAGDVVVIQDADLEYDPKEYTELLQPILEGRAHVVYGSRLTGGKPTRAFHFWHYMGNKFLTLLTNLLYDCTITDMETCYKVFRRDVFNNIKIKSNRFDFEPEITAKVLKQKVKIYELPISYHGRDYSEGKKITWKDGFGAVWALIKYRFVD